MNNHALSRVTDTFGDPQPFGQSLADARDELAPVVPKDLAGVADQIEAAVNHLHSGYLTAGTALAVTALARMRSLLGEVDTPRPGFTPLPAVEEFPPVVVSAKDLKVRVNGLIQRNIPLRFAVENADSGEVLSRLVYRPGVPVDGADLDELL